jgi:hypothetical protein
MKSKWQNPQSIIITLIIILIFSYISIDIIRTKPQIKENINEVRKEYRQLSGFLDKKIPEIDSTLKHQADQISKQGKDLDILNYRIERISIDFE